MEMITNFFGLFLGLFAIFGALSVVTNGYSWRKLLGNIEENHAVLLLAATLELFLGLLIVISHPYYQIGWPLLITIIGWMAIIEASILFILPSWAISFSKWSIDKPALHSWALISFFFGVTLLMGVMGII